MRCGVVVDYTGSMPDDVGEVLRLIDEAGCLSLCCDIAVASVVPGYVSEANDCSIVVKGLIEELERRGRSGSSVIVQYIGKVISKLSEIEDAEDDALLLVLTDGLQDKRFADVNPLKRGSLRRLFMHIVLFEGKGYFMHSIDTFAYKLAYILRPFSENRSSLFSVILRAVTDVREKRENEVQIVDGDLTITVVSADAVKTSSNPCEVLKMSCW